MGVVACLMPAGEPAYSVQRHTLSSQLQCSTPTARPPSRYQLFWPTQSEFVRMAARHEAIIIPISSIGAEVRCNPCL